MKIEKIEIKGLFGKKDICWELNQQVNVLVGVNGSGKSTILSIIHGFLNQYMENKIELLFDDAHMDFYENKRIFFEKYSRDKNQDDLKKKLGEVEFINFIEKNPNFFEGFVSGFTFRDRDIARKKELLYYDLIESNMTNSNANHIIQKSNQEKTNALDMEIRDTIHEFNKIKTDELVNQLTGSLNVFFNQIGKHVSYENNELVYTDTQLQQKLNYSHLSSGERQLIYILLRVALSNGDKSKTAIILMDEPEISLHINWQAHFIKQLTVLNPDAQFIIVTHSPAMIMNGWNDVYVNMEDITQ